MTPGIFRRKTRGASAIDDLICLSNWQAIFFGNRVETESASEFELAINYSVGDAPGNKHSRTTRDIELVGQFEKVVRFKGSSAAEVAFFLRFYGRAEARPL